MHNNCDIYADCLQTSKAAIYLRKERVKILKVGSTEPLTLCFHGLRHKHSVTRKHGLVYVNSSVKSCDI